MISRVENVGSALVARKAGHRRRRPPPRPGPPGARIAHRHHVGRQTFAQLALFRLGGGCKGECEKSEPREVEKSEAACPPLPRLRAGQLHLAADLTSPRLRAARLSCLSTGFPWLLLPHD